MKILLAGYNIDIELIKKLENQELATPETISAAYARISRSEKDVTSLRNESLQEVEKARKSNANIIYEMGHSSIAEHAMFNFDLIGISRLMSELIHRSRLASFTEKSQRYVTLQGDYVVPEEIKDNKALLNEFHAMIEKQNHLYESLYNRGVDYLKSTGFEGKRRELEGKAKEDARYVLSLATQTQMGITINGRSLERLLRRLDGSPLIEAKALKESIEKEVKHIAPSIIKYTNSDSFGELISTKPTVFEQQVIKANIIDISKDAEKSILIAHLMDLSGYSYIQAKSIVENMNQEEIACAFQSIFKDLKSYHSVPRSFEMCDITFELSMSSSCFAQLKRHRMASIYRSSYHPSLSYVIPPLLRELHAEKEIEDLMALSTNLYNKFEGIKPGLGAYCMTNAHYINVLMKLNLRELYHFVRLRSDMHAQWEIKQLSDEIVPLVKTLLPNSAQFLFGKDEFTREY
ncbi:MAG TPA: FAD-dependent thymidylate synthase [Candidatus Cloacimonadota bacterium]|nr:FAD-dependent thymidylate synthase [Candidatus Cloacimonadota bacterium]HPK40620.1 FAD-dependent thymidylate synthase [Candidatus Cloacimonadota bacterium]